MQIKALDKDKSIWYIQIMHMVNASKVKVKLIFKWYV